MIQALSLPVVRTGSARSTRSSIDAENPSTYGENLVSTGPYMVQNDCVNTSGKVVNPNCTGKLTGYTPSKEIHLVRNPNWDPNTDFRPAYAGLDHDPGGLHRHRLGVARRSSRASDQVNGDFVPSKTIIQQVASGQKYSQDQLTSRPQAATATSP